MNELLVQLDDLPDEILMHIFKKLHNVEVLYSFIGVNKRLNEIVQDSIFTSSLTLLSHLSYDFTHPLPEIHHKIKFLNLESSSMERILLATNYPNLYGLGLYKIGIEKALSLFSGKKLE